MSDSIADLVLTPFLVGSFSVPSCHRLTAEVAILGGDVRGESGRNGRQPGGGAAAGGRVPCRQVLIPSAVSTSPGCRVSDHCGSGSRIRGLMIRGNTVANCLFPFLGGQITFPGG